MSLFKQPEQQYVPAPKSTKKRDTLFGLAMVGAVLGTFARHTPVGAALLIGSLVVGVLILLTTPRNDG